jgi:methyltransferase
VRHRSKKRIFTRGATIESAMAHWIFAPDGIEYGRSHYNWMVLMHSLFLIAMLTEYLQCEPKTAASIRVFAMIGAIVCQVLRWWIIGTLGRQWNSRVIIVPGLSRIRSGPYRFLKHPNYVVVALETVFLPLIFGSWRTALLFSILNLSMMSVRIRVKNEALLGLRSI